VADPDLSIWSNTPHTVECVEVVSRHSNPGVRGAETGLDYIGLWRDSIRPLLWLLVRPPLCPLASNYSPVQATPGHGPDDPRYEVTNVACGIDLPVAPTGGGLALPSRWRAPPCRVRHSIGRRRVRDAPLAVASCPSAARCHRATTALTTTMPGCRGWFGSRVSARFAGGLARDGRRPIRARACRTVRLSLSDSGRKRRAPERGTRPGSLDWR
jgi:hypothetical protein